MQLGISSTQVFYNLLDLDEAEQRIHLAQLETCHPALYQQVKILLDSCNAEPLTELLGFCAQQALQDQVDLSEMMLDKYHLTHELGRGGMGVVYAAERADNTFEQELAIKFIQPTLTKILGPKALFDEAQLLARLSHPNIAKVFDGGVHQERVYIVMERVKGVTLNRYLAQHLPSKQQRLELFIQLCRAVEHAHQNQVLHADLKPENVLVDDHQQIKLLDFNLTQKAANQTKSEHQSLIAFSQDYASPEQRRGEFLTAQSDVYSLAKILALLFPDDTAQSELALIIKKGSNINPNHRYASTAELRMDIEHHLACRPISLKSHLGFYRFRKLIQRRPIPSSLATLLLSSGFLFSAMLIGKNQQLEQEKLIAENMMYEVTRLMFHGKGQAADVMSVNSMLELTRRRVLSNPNIPPHIKQKMLLAMMTPVPTKPTAQCQSPSCPNNPALLSPSTLATKQ